MYWLQLVSFDLLEGALVFVLAGEESVAFSSRQRSMEDFGEFMGTKDSRKIGRTVPCCVFQKLFVKKGVLVLQTRQKETTVSRRCSEPTRM